jgi:hypothetical protein
MVRSGGDAGVHECIYIRQRNNTQKKKDTLIQRDRIKRKLITFSKLLFFLKYFLKWK